METGALFWSSCDIMVKIWTPTGIHNENYFIYHTFQGLVFFKAKVLPGWFQFDQAFWYFLKANALHDW